MLDLQSQSKDSLKAQENCDKLNSSVKDKHSHILNSTSTLKNKEICRHAPKTILKT